MIRIALPASLLAVAAAVALVARPDGDTPSARSLSVAPCCSEEPAAQPPSARAPALAFRTAAVLGSAPALVPDEPDGDEEDSGASGGDEDEGKDGKGDGEEKAEEKGEDEGKEKPEVEIDPSLGIIEGRVVLEGPPPELDPQAVKVPENHQDHAKCAKHVKDERLILSDDDEKGVKNAVVYVGDYRHRGPGRPKPREVVLDNEHCLFVPHVVATTVQSELVIRNSDKFIHNTRGLLATGGINVAIPPEGKLPGKKLRKPGWGVMKCDFHPWMTAHVHVFSHEMFAVTKKDGSFRIVNVPPGEHDLHFWHEVLENDETGVEVRAGEATEIEFGLERYEG